MNGLRVSCRQLVHIYRSVAGDVVALSGVDLDIAPGETVALIGPSGSGKSTLIALLAGLTRPSAGRVMVGTTELGRMSDRELTGLRGTAIGVVVQGAERNLLTHLSLRDNVWLAQRRAVDQKRQVDPPERILHLVGMTASAGELVDRLPAGARQRAALAVGIAAGPGLLLVDEPTSQLDTAGRDEVMSALETVNATNGTTIVVVTHDPEVGGRLGRVITIRDGRVGAEGRGGRDFAVIAGDGTVQLPPEVLGALPPGTLLDVDYSNGRLSMSPTDSTGGPAPAED